MNADERERVRVLDFGMAKLIDIAAEGGGGGLTQAGEILGHARVHGARAGHRRRDRSAHRRLRARLRGVRDVDRHAAVLRAQLRHRARQAHGREAAAHQRRARRAAGARCVRGAGAGEESGGSAGRHGRGDRRRCSASPRTRACSAMAPARTIDLPSMPSLAPMSRMSSTKRRFTRMKRRTKRNLVAGVAALVLLLVGAFAEWRLRSAAAGQGAGRRSSWRRRRRARR